MHIARQDDGVAVVELDSEVSSGERESLDSFEHLCSDLVHRGVRCILLDLNGIQTAPSVFFAALASLQNMLHSLGGEIAVIHPTSRMRKLFRVTVMDQVVGVYGELQDALDGVHKHLEAMRRALQKDLAGPKKPERIKAASKLAKMGENQGFELLSEFLGDDDPVTRLQAAMSLASMGGVRVVEPLIRALADGEYRVRMCAAEALGKIGDARAIEPLRAAVRFERNRNVVFKANQALEELLKRSGPLSSTV